MRIGIYDPYFDDLGGGEKYMMSIAQCLSEKHTVDVFWDNTKDVDTLLQRFHLDLSKVRMVRNIFSPHISLPERLWATRKYDALIVLSDGSIPLVLSKKLLLHIQQPLSRAQTGNLWEKFKMSRVSKVFCNSLYTKEFVDTMLSINALVIYPPVPIHAKKIKKEDIILHVGRFRVANVGLADYKKQSVMVDVFKQMVDKGLHGWKFIVASGLREQDRKEFSRLEKMAEEYPISFEINKSNDQLWDLYSKAKIYWHASGFGEDLQKHPEYAEHFGISTVEAMGAGCVPVVINAGGQREIIQDGRNGFLWDTLDQLQERTRRLVTNEKELKKLSEDAIKSAENFNYEKFSQEVNKLVI